MHTENIEYQAGDTTLEGFLAYDEQVQGKRPAVIIAHDWTGRRDFPCSKAVELAEAGFVGFALDMYGKGVFGNGEDVEANAALMNPLVADRTALRQRILAALDVVKNLPEVDSSRIVAMGYCFGGMCVLELARAGADVRGVVSIHGIFSAGDIPNEKILSSVLCLHGHDDPMVPPEQVLALETEMTEAGVDWQMQTYGGTMHAFTNPDANNPDFGAMYSATADQRSTRALHNFLDEVIA
jgi:dienelactone hydrolase